MVALGNCVIYVTSAMLGLGNYVICVTSGMAASGATWAPAERPEPWSLDIEKKHLFVETIDKSIVLISKKHEKDFLRF